MLFSDKDLRKLVFPLMMDQVLQNAVGIADSIMVASVGEAAVSGVSLVDTVMTLIILVSTAFATGGAVVAGQYIGKGKPEMACRVTNELLVFTAEAFMAVMAAGYLGRNLLMNVVFGRIEPDVMQCCQTYLLIVFASIPLIALYNSGAAILRSMGDSQSVMKISMLMNGINVGGNLILIYGFHMGVAGVAIPTLLSRAAACIAVLVLLKDQKKELHILFPVSVRTDWNLLKKILYIGLPNAAENGMFQMGKILVLSMVSGMGTAAIAANAVSSTLERFVVLPGNSIGLAMVTVCAQCMGLGDYKQVKYYTGKLLRMTYFWMAVVNLSMLAMLPLILRVYGLSAEASRYVLLIMIYHTVCTITIWPMSFSLPYMLRAVGDVHYTLFWAIVSMWIFRIGFSWILGIRLGWGVFGIWVAMTIDWLFRSFCMGWRYFSGKWQHEALV